MLACPLLTLENILHTIQGGPSIIFPGAQCGLLSQNCLEYSKYGIYEHSIGIVGLSPLVHIQYENRHFTSLKRNGYLPWFWTLIQQMWFFTKRWKLEIICYPIYLIKDLSKFEMSAGGHHNYCRSHGHICKWHNKNLILSKKLLFNVGITCVEGMKFWNWMGCAIYNPNQRN